MELDRSRIYLGPWGDSETQIAYHRLIAEWSAAGYRLPSPKDELTVMELAASYLDHCRVYYRDISGSPNTECHRRALLALRHPLPAAQFGPKALSTVRQQWVDRDLSITTINGYVGFIKRAFKWATFSEMISVEILQALCTLPGLRR